MNSPGSPRIAVIGHPIAHSLSPLIHEFWLSGLGLAGTYSRLDVAPRDLPGFFTRMRDGRFDGANVTIPNKRAAIKLCDHTDPAVTAIGALNTLVVKRSGDGTAIYGSNTDFAGFLANLDAEAPGWDEAASGALVLGAGGAARAIVYALAQRGFAPITVLNRTLENAQNLVAGLQTGGCKELFAAPLSEFSNLAKRTGLLVNTTAIGMHGTAFRGLDLALLPATALVTDIVYTPIDTPLLQQAGARGLRTVGGLGMLLHQAVPGFEAWFGQKPAVTRELRAHLLAHLQQGS